MLQRYKRSFIGKSHQQLALLEIGILKKIKGQEEGVDIGYWETLHGYLKAHMARARLGDRHQETLRRKLAKLKQEQRLEEAASGSVSTVKMEPMDTDDLEPSPGPSLADEQSLTNAPISSAPLDTSWQ